MKKLFFIAAILVVFSGCFNNNTKIKIITTEGNITLELFDEEAPATVKNFLKYVDGGHYKNAHFYRSVTMNNQPDDSIKIEVIQGGIWEDKNIYTPVVHETTQQTGIKHTDGTISMARSTPGTAQDDFFICIGDQPDLDYKGRRNKDGKGFAAFGKVVEGMDIVNKIHKSQCEAQFLNPKILIKNIERVK